MSLLWVAKQLPPRLNNQQLPPVSARVKGCAAAARAAPGPAEGGAPTLRGSRVRSPPPERSPPHPSTRPRCCCRRRFGKPAGKARIPPKSRWKSDVGALRRGPARKAVRAAVRKSAVRREEGRGRGAAHPGRDHPRPRRATAAVAWLPPPTACALPGGTSTPRLPGHPVPQFPRGTASPTVPAPAPGWGEPGWLPLLRRQLPFPPLYSPEFFFFLFFLFFFFLLCCQLFLCPGANL